MFSRYHIIKNEEELHQLIRCCIESGYASVDFETNGQPIYMDSFRPTILSVTFKAGFGCSIPLAHFSMPEDHPWVEWLTKFGRRVVENPKVTKIAWNWKFDNQIFHRYHIYHEGTVIDGMLAKYILNEERPNGLKDMVRRYLPDFTDYEKSEGFDKIPWDKKELKPLCEYGCMDTDMTFRLGLFFESKLIKGKYYPLYRNLIMAASRVLQSAEEFGLPLDIELNKRLREKYAKLISDCTEKLMNNPVVYKYNLDMLINKRNQYISKIRGEIEDLSVNPEKNKRSIATREAKISRVLAGEYQTKEEKALVEPINFGSQKQMVGLLFSKEGFNFPVLEYTVNKDTKQQSDNPSTSEATLLKLKEYDKTGFIDTLLELRGHQTINSTFIVGLGDLVQDDKKVHPTFLIHGCVSGDTMLVCKDKDIRISDISPREPGSLNIEDKDIWVLTHECTWEQVTHSINKGHQPMYHVVTHSGKTIDCTYDHKFLTVKGMKTLRYILRHGTPLVMNDVSKLSFEKPIKTGRKSTEVVFKEIPGYPGYLASSEGKIFSVKAIGSQGKVLDYNHPHEMMPGLSKNGRYRVGLRLNDGRRHMEQVSRLVWMAFNDSFIPDGMVIDHIDTITTNDIPENLQCISSSENISRAYSMTRSSYTHGSINGMSKLDVLKVANIKRELDICIPQQHIAHKYGVSQKQVSRIANGKAWGYIYLDRVFSCTPMGSQVVYDLSVNKNHSYVTRGEFISSNTTSGRLSSRNPNGQNIPKTMVNPDVKLQFIPPEGHLFFTYDYSQAELRILAHLAGEETMLEWFRTGKDIHLASACKKYHENYDEILKIYEDEQNPQYKLWKKRRKQAKCFSGDTEILTESGWQRFDQYNGDRVAQYNMGTKAISFVNPLGYGRVRSGSIMEYEDRNISLTMTSNHECLMVTRHGVLVKDEAINLVGKSGYMISAGYHKSDYEDELFTRLLAMIVSDGSIRPNMIRLGFKKKRKIDRCKYLLDEYGLKYSMNFSHEKGVTSFVVRDFNFYKRVSTYVSRDKTLYWKCLTKIDGSIYLDEARLWDGNTNYDFSQERSSFSSSNQQTLDVMQAMGVINGIRVIRYENHISYRPIGRELSRVNLKNLHFIPGNQFMYCVSVPDGNIVIRKDGKPSLQGNCINFGIVYEQSAPKLAESLSTPEEQVSVEEAQGFLDVFFSDFPKVKAFMDRQHKFMEDHGYVRSLFGRRRRCPKVYSESYREYLEALRQATNMPCQSAASDMALFASVLVYEKVRKGELPPMVEADTVHDSVYQFIQPQYITPDTVFKVWDICRNPSTKEYFGFSIDDVDMSMDFTIGRTMAEELPYVPGYDYKKMLSPDFNLDEYYEEHRKVKEISIKEYPEKFKEYFETSWRQRK